MAGKTTLKETMKWEKVSTDCSEAVDGAAGLELIMVSSPHGSPKTLKLRTHSR